MKLLRWAIGAITLLSLFIFIIIKPIPFLFYHDLPNVDFLGRAIYIILVGGGMCLFRILKGPSAADRIVAVDILGILIVGFCAVLTIATHRNWYIDIAIAWALQAFISDLALSKYLEGKGFDE